MLPFRKYFLLDFILFYSRFRLRGIYLSASLLAFSSATLASTLFLFRG